MIKIKLKSILVIFQIHLIFLSFYLQVTDLLQLRRSFMNGRSPRLDQVARKRAFLQYIADLGPGQECDLSPGERKIYKRMMRKIIRDVSRSAW